MFSTATPLPRRQRIVAEVRALWHLAWPILVGQLATIGMSVTDVTMAGHASAQDLAGVSLGTSIWNLAVLTIMGLAMAVNPLVAHQVGASAPHQVAHLVRQGLWKALFTGLLASSLTLLALPVFVNMQLEPRVLEVATRFVCISAASLPAFAAYRVLYGYSTSLNQTKPMMAIALIACLFNGVLDWLLVTGAAGFPRLGGVGCAWATLSSIWLQLVLLLWWMRRSPAYRSTWPLAQWEWPHAETLGRLLRLGLPIGVTYFAESSAFSLIALLIARFGSTEVAAHAIALNFSALIFMVPLSLGLALLTRVGHSLGAGDGAQAYFRTWVGLGMAMSVACLSAAGVAWGNTRIAGAYTSDPAVTTLAAKLLVLAALFQLPDCAQVVASCALRGYRKTRWPMVVHLTAFWGFALPLGYYWGRAPDWFGPNLAPPQAAQGFWNGLIVGLSVAGVGLVVMLRSVSRASRRQTPPAPPAQPAATPQAHVTI